MALSITLRKQMISSLPTRYKQAIDEIEAAGGTVSDFALDLIVNAEKNKLSCEDIIEILKNHYTTMGLN